MKTKTLLLSITAVIAMSALGLGATMAVFTDQKSTETEFQSGRLCIQAQRDATDPVPGPMFYMTGYQGRQRGVPNPALGKFPTAGGPPNTPGFSPETIGGWAPGDSATRTLNVYNGSFIPLCYSLEAKLTRITAKLIPDEFGNPSYEPLAHKMKVTITASPAGTEIPVVVNKPLSDFLTPTGVDFKYQTTGLNPILPPFQPGDLDRPVLQMKFTVTFDIDTPNEYQDKTMVVNFYIDGEQLRNNP